MIHSVLSAYSSMSKCTSAEEIIRHNLCRPVMQQTLEKANIQNLPSIFNDILDFVPTYLKTIQQIITGKYKKMHAIAGYDFIARSVFPEIVSGLQESSRNYLFLYDFIKRNMFLSQKLDLSPKFIYTW